MYLKNTCRKGMQILNNGIKSLYIKRLSVCWRKLTLQKPKTGKSLKYTNTNIQLTQKKCLPSLYQNEKITEVLMGKMECQMQKTNKIWGD